MSKESCRSALLVEDDDELRSSIASVLAESGYEAFAVAGLAEARAALQHRPEPSVIVLDLVLEGENGVDLLYELAGLDEPPPTILVSGSCDAAAVAADFDVALLAKPFDIDDLVREVDHASEGHHRPSRRTLVPS